MPGIGEEQRMQRVDAQECRPGPSGNLGKMAEILEIAEADGAGGSQGIELAGHAPGRLALRCDAGKVRYMAGRLEEARLGRVGVDPHDGQEREKRRLAQAPLVPRLRCIMRLYSVASRKRHQIMRHSASPSITSWRPSIKPTLKPRIRPSRKSSNVPPWFAKTSVAPSRRPGSKSSPMSHGASSRLAKQW